MIFKLSKTAFSYFLVVAVLLSLIGCGENKNAADNVSSNITASEIIDETSSGVQTSSKDTSTSSKNGENSSGQTSSKGFLRPSASSKPKEVDNSMYNLNYVFNKSVYENEFFNRGGLYNTISKLQNGQDVTIAYLGGSITRMKGYRNYTTQYFEQNYQGSVKEVYAALAGTGAALGVCRLDKDILAHNPDLLFVEYASNGGNAEQLEGIVLKVWESDPTIDICFIYTGGAQSYEIYSSGKLPEFVEMSEKLADYYDIPSVFFTKQAFDMCDAGKLTVKAYVPDNTHPSDEGHKLAAGAIARSVVSMEKSFNKDGYRIKKHTLKSKTHTKSPWISATYSTDMSKLKFEGEWKTYPLNSSGEYTGLDYSVYYDATREIAKEIVGTKKAGSSVTIKFKGTNLGILKYTGPFTGQLRLTVDGIDKGILEIYHKNTDAEPRLLSTFLDEIPYGEHTVTLTLDENAPDKSYLMNKYPDDKRYLNNEFYFTRILVNGELLDANK